MDSSAVAPALLWAVIPSGCQALRPPSCQPSLSSKPGVRGPALLAFQAPSRLERDLGLHCYRCLLAMSSSHPPQDEKSVLVQSRVEV